MRYTGPRRLKARAIIIALACVPGIHVIYQDLALPANQRVVEVVPARFVRAGATSRADRLFDHDCGSCCDVPDRGLLAVRGVGDVVLARASGAGARSF